MIEKEGGEGKKAARAGAESASEGDGDDDEQRAKGGKDDGVIADSPQLVADLALDSSIPPDISL